MAPEDSVLAIIVSSTIAEILSEIWEVLVRQTVQILVKSHHKVVIKIMVTQVCLTLWSLYAVALMAVITVQVLRDPTGGATNTNTLFINSTVIRF
jgi:hypothetical protein